MMSARRSTSGTGSGNPFVPLGRSPAIVAAIGLARKVAPTDAPVLLTGEAGTGKEMIAHLIHREGPRGEGPFVPAGCSLLPSERAEVELFGEEPRGEEPDPGERGLLMHADGGTLLLDDVDSLPHAVQVRILRMIERRIGPGASRASVLAPLAPEAGRDVRFMATLTAPAEAAVGSGQLRSDLFYRLAVFPIPIPALRDRVEDIPLLASHFLAHFWHLNRKRSRPPTLTKAALRALQERAWSGNVRELQHVMERLAVLHEPGANVLPENLPESALPSGPEHGSSPANRGSEGNVDLSDGLMSRPFSEAKSRLTAEFEREYLVRLIRRVGGNMTTAAELGGVNKTTLYRLLQKHDLTKEEVLKG